MASAQSIVHDPFDIASAIYCVGVKLVSLVLSLYVRRIVISIVDEHLYLPVHLYRASAKNVFYDTRRLWQIFIANWIDR